MANATSQSENLKEFCQRITALEKDRGSRIFCMIHQGRHHICGPTMRAVYANRIEAGYGDKLEILMHSPGGHPDYAYQVMKFFRRRYKEVTIIVPLMAKSAATLMCLGADKIYMGEFGDLGPIDIQIDDPVDKGEKAVSPLDEFKSLEYMRDMAMEWMAYCAAVSNQEYGLSIRQGLEHSVPLVTGLMRPILSQIDPLEVGSYRRSLAIGEEYGKRMLALTGQENDDMVHELVWEYPSHSFCIDFEEAERLGLPVERLTPNHDHAFCEAIFALERGHYHGFASSQKVVKKSTAPPAVLSKRTVKNGSVGGDNGGGDGIGQGKSATPPTNTVKDEEEQASTNGRH